MYILIYVFSCFYRGILGPPERSSKERGADVQRRLGEHAASLAAAANRVDVGAAVRRVAVPVKRLPLDNKLIIAVILPTTYVLIVTDTADER